jgi:hypothetical protein
MSTIMVQGPEPEEIELMLAMLPLEGATLTKPGEVDVAFWGGVHPLGITKDTCEPVLKFPFGLSNLKLKVFPVLPAQGVRVGEPVTVILPCPLVACA